jgi:Holliday junction DNA helicase RuvA
VLFIETYVREDQLKLFGFETALEREWFRLLQNVQGVGAKVALAVLSTLSRIRRLANAIALQRYCNGQRVRPVSGKKVAERIVTELKNKAPALSGEAGGSSIDLKQELGEGVASAPGCRCCVCTLQSGLLARSGCQCGGRGDEGQREKTPDSAKLIRFGLKELAR